MRLRSAVVFAFLLFATTALAGASFADVSPLKDPVTGRTFALVTDRGIRVHPGSQPGAHLQALPASIAKAAADAFLQANRDAIGWIDPEVALTASPVLSDDLGESHVYYHQSYRGVPVFAGEVITHVGPDGEVYYATTKLAQGFPASVTPSVTPEAAKVAAQEQAHIDAPQPVPTTAGVPKLLLLPLGILQNTASSEATLAWEVSVHDDQGGNLVDQTYYVDAVTGSVVFTLSNRAYLDRRVYDWASPDGNADLDVFDPPTNYWYGRSEGAPARGPSPHPGYVGSTNVDSLYSGLGAMHNFTSSSFGINGANNQGGTGFGSAASQTLGYVHLDNSGTGFYECPRGALFRFDTGQIDFCAGQTVPDIYAHEYGHAIVQHAAIAHGYAGGPTYFGQTGALNEAFADIMGEAFEKSYTGTNDWKSGTGSTGGAFRDIANPPASANKPPNYTLVYPLNYYYSSVYCGNNPATDQGGVHINSTIISHAFYRMVVGGDEIGCDITPIGMEAAKQIFYRSWRYYFSQSATFAEAYYGIQQACADLYPTPTCDDVRGALDAARLNLPGKCSGQPEPVPTCGPVQHVTNAFTAKLKAGIVTDDTLFTVGEHLIVHGTGNAPNRSVRLYLRTVSTVPPNYVSLSTGPFAQEFNGMTTTGPNGELNFTFPNALHQSSPVIKTDYQLYIDGNADGMWEPWCDMYVLLHIRVPQDGDGLCYSGESYATSENCQSSPLDCACTGGATCQLNGSGQYVCASASGVDGVPLPSRVALAIVGANPARGPVQLAAALPKAATLDVTVYGVQGRVVRRLLSQTQMPAGINAVSWDGRDDGGALLAGGVYFVRMRVGDETYRQTVVLLR